MKIRETWTVQRILEKLAQHTDTDVDEIQLFTDCTIIRDHFNAPSMEPLQYVTSYQLTDGSKIRALRTIKLGEVKTTVIKDHPLNFDFARFKKIVPLLRSKIRSFCNTYLRSKTFEYRYQPGDY